jgi:hypothetical protein
MKRARNFTQACELVRQELVVSPRRGRGRGREAAQLGFAVQGVFDRMPGGIILCRNARAAPLDGLRQKR